VASRVQNVGSLRRKLRQIEPDVREELSHAFAEIAPELASAISEAAPKDTGRLAAASTGQVSRDQLAVAVGYSPKRAGFRRAWLKGGFEALWAEFGTKHSRAQPFISPTFQRLLPSMLDRIERAVIVVVSKAGNR
jgi:HK97 gp10 family phage protein